MSDNPILDELQEIRAKLSDQFGSDIDAIGQHLRDRQSRRGGPTVSRPPKSANTLVVSKPTNKDQPDGTNVKQMDRSAAR